MRFIIDENVPHPVIALLTGEGHEAASILEHVLPGTEDPIVAAVAEHLQAVLISFDGDFKRIAPRVPDGQRRRFRDLSRTHMACVEFEAVDRLRLALPFIEFEYNVAMEAGDRRMHLQIGASYLRSNR